MEPQKPFRFCLVSDLDHTMVDHSDPVHTSLLDFGRLWSSKFRHDSYLVYSTGRSLELYQALFRTAPLLIPNLVICSVGTEIYHGTSEGLALDEDWTSELSEDWDRSRIVTLVHDEIPELVTQPASEQRPFKVSYHLKCDEAERVAVVERLQTVLSGDGLEVKVIHSGGIDVDVLPKRASKGLAVQYLEKRWKDEGSVFSEGIQVCGDSGNDIELFQAPGVYGCVVSNAMEELKTWAEQNPSEKILRPEGRCAAAILQTMEHFGKVPSDDSVPVEARVRKALVDLYAARMAWRNGTVERDPDWFASNVSLKYTSNFDGHACGEELTSLEDYGNDATSPVLMWLDQIIVDKLDGGEFKATFADCFVKGEKQRVCLLCEAHVVPSDDPLLGFQLQTLKCLGDAK